MLSEVLPNLIAINMRYHILTQNICIKRKYKGYKPSLIIFYEKILLKRIPKIINWYLKYITFVNNEKKNPC